MPVLAMLVDDPMPEWGAVIGASLAAAYCDVRIHRVPNWLTLPLAITGAVHAAWLNGFSGLGEAAGTWIVLALPYILLFARGHGGAGDAKMMGAIGAWLGLRQGVAVLCCVAVAGGALALLRLAVHAQRRLFFRNLMTALYVYGVALTGGRSGWGLLKNTDAPKRAHDPPEPVTLPYAIAIFFGVCLGAVVGPLWMQ